MSFSSDQAEFMRAAGQLVGDDEGSDPVKAAQAYRYIKHLAEEARETLEAWSGEGTFEEVIDGLVDTIVVALGGLHSLGVDPDRCWSAVHAANMRKVNGSCGPKVFREDGQIGKPEGWFGPEDELRQIWIDQGFGRGYRKV